MLYGDEMVFLSGGWVCGIGIGQYGLQVSSCDIPVYTYLISTEHETLYDFTGVFRGQYT